MVYTGKASFSPDGRKYAFTRLDSAVQINDTASGQAVDVLYGHSKPALGITYTADGDHLITGSMDGTIMLRDLTKTDLDDDGIKKIEQPRNPVLAIDASPDSSKFVTACIGDYQALRIWSTQTGELLQSLDYHGDAVYEARYSPDGANLASAGWDRRIVIWNMGQDVDRRGELAEGDLDLEGHEGEVLSVDFSPDGRRLVSGSFDNTIRIWDTASGMPVHQTVAHEHPVTSVRFVGQNLLVSSSFDKTIKFWDSELSLLKTRGPFEYGIHSVACSPDSTFMIAVTKAGPIAGKVPDFI